eukprot:10309824-Ditylum_brightwellii.AAC.1
MVPLEEFIEPHKHVMDWNTKECNAYMKHYGIKFQGNMQERREFVQKAYNDDTIIKLSPEELFGSTVQVENDIQSLNSVISHVMAKDVDESLIAKSDRHICIFLHHLEKLDSVINKGCKKFKLQSSYSFLTALQITEVMRKYGSLRNVWKGTFIGEGILAKVKPLIKDLRKTGILMLVESTAEDNH